MLCEDGPWVDWWQRDINSGYRQGPASKPARTLRPYGVRGGTHRLRNGWTRKGYKAEDFSAGCKRCLAAGPAA